MEREYLRTERSIRLDVTAPLTKKQIFCYRVYRLGMRLRLINEPSEGAVVQYSIDETLKAAEKASAAAFQAHVEAIKSAKEQATEETAVADELTETAERPSDNAASQKDSSPSADQAPSEETSSEQTKS